MVNWNTYTVYVLPFNKVFNVFTYTLDKVVQLLRYYLKYTNVHIHNLDIQITCTNKS